MAAFYVPTQRTRFIGRTAEIAEIVSLLQRVRLVTLTGPGGSGKTRLALEAARALSDSFSGGVCWVELASTAGEGAVADAIAVALQLHEQPGQLPNHTIAHWISDQRLVLLLDNCEHLIGASAEAAETLLAACPHLRIIATSREPLAVNDEVVVAVQSLPLPKADDLEVVQKSEAIALFVDRAASRVDGFELTASNAASVAQICRRLDGMPLGIELAAARTDVLTVHQITERLEDRFALLTAGSPVAPARHQTLRAAIDWSHDLLAPQEKALLRRMAVFAGGCSLDAVQAVCVFDNLSEDQSLDILASLIAKSLLVSETVGRSEARYGMLETIRQFAQEMLIEAGEETSLRDRHLDYFLARSEEIAPKLRGPYQQLWLNWLEGEHDNLRAALAWALESKRIEAGLRLVISLYDFWVPRGHLREAIRWSESFLDQAPHDAPLLLLAQANLSLAGPAWMTRDFASSERHTRAAVALAEKAGEGGKAVLAFALFGQGSLAMGAGDYRSSYELHLRALNLRRELGEAPLIAFSLLGFSDAATGLGRFEEARRALEEGLALSEQAGERFWNANILKAMGNLERLEHRPGQAVNHFEQSASRFRALGAERETALVLTSLALALLDQGEVGQARELLGESLALHQEVDNTDGVIACLAAFAELAAAVDRSLDASRLLKAAEALAELYPALIFPAERLLRERFKAALQALLPDPAWEQTQRQGRLLGMKDAIALALSLPATAPSSATNELTRREREIVMLVSRGMTNGDIASTLVISKRTVEKHIANIFSKLDLTDRTQLVLWSIENGLGGNGG